MTKERILIVENEPAVAEAIEGCLTQEGYAVSMTTTGEQGIRSAAELRPDLALMDIYLGGAVDGVQLAERLQSRYDIPVVFLTGLPGEPNLQRSGGAEAFAYLLKPFRPEELKACVELALAKHRRNKAERARSEQALRESEERYRRLFELCPGAVLVHCAGKIVLINSAGAKLLGAERPEEIIGKAVLDIIHADYHEVVRARIETLKQGGSVALMEQKIVCLDGTVIDVEVTAGAMVYYQEPAIQVIIRDIRKRKRLEFQKAQITQLSHRLNSAATPAEAARIIVDTADTLLGWDACHLALYSQQQDKMLALLNIDEINGRRQDVTPAHFVTEPTRFERRVLAEGGCLILRGGVSDEELGLARFGDLDRPSASLLFAPIRDGARVTGVLSIQSYGEHAYSGDELGLLQFLADHCGGALERLRAEEALRESEERFHAFMNHSPVLAFIKTESGQYVYGNRAWAAQWKKTAAEIMGKTDVDLWPESIALQFQASDAAVFATGKPLEVIQTIPEGEKRSRSWIVLKFLIDNANGAKLLGGLALDITARRQAEEELNRSRGQLRSLAAHLQTVREEERIRIAREIHDELGQLLTGFKMDLSWLDKRLPRSSDDSIRTRLAEKVRSMSAMVDDMVDTVRRISAELRPGVLDDLGLVPAMEWQLREFQKRAGIDCHLTTNLEGRALPPEICTAVFRICQETLTNIARHASASRVSVRLEETSGDLILRVEDNGRGITDSDLANPKSLGLAGIRERAMMLGGEFQISGAPSQGTTANVRIPLVEALNRSASLSHK